MATNSNPTVWIITTIDASGDAGVDSNPTNWITASIDDQPVGYDGNSLPTDWIIAKITFDPANPPTANSNATAWIITTLDVAGLPSGIFLVIAGDTLVPVEID